MGGDSDSAVPHHMGWDSDSPLMGGWMSRPDMPMGGSASPLMDGWGLKKIHPWLCKMGFFEIPPSWVRGDWVFWPV